jgi:hypothetical protein
MTKDKATKPAAPPKFKVGDKVRVKHGIVDAEYPDCGRRSIVTAAHGQLPGKLARPRHAPTQLRRSPATSHDPFAR